MKSIYRLSVALLAIFIFLIQTGCTSKTSMGYFRVMTTFSNEDGLLYSENGALRFLDYKTKKSMYLCAKPDCSHTDRNTCSAYSGYYSPFIVGKKMYYYTQQSSFDEDGNLDIKTQINESDVSGSNQKVLGATKGWFCYFAGTYYLDGVLYFFTQDDEYKNNISTGRATISLWSFEINTREAKRIASLGTGYGISISGFDIFNGSLYCHLAYFNDEEENELFSSALCINLSDGTIAPLDKPFAIAMMQEYYFFIEDGSTYMYNLETGIEEKVIDKETSYSGKDGNTIYLQTYHEGNYDIYTYDLESGKLECRISKSSLTFSIVGSNQDTYFGYFAADGTEMNLGYIQKQDFLSENWENRIMIES